VIRLELWVEGPTDARTHRPGIREDEASRAVGGALIPLIRKALGEDAPPLEEIAAYRLTGKLRGVTRLGDRDRRRQLSTKGWKVLAAIDQARSHEPRTAIVAIWDRDGEDEPLRDRKIIQEALEERGSGGACVGICVEEVEAWLLADPSAFRGCFGRGPKGGLPGQPEAEADPKATLEAVLSEYEQESGRAEIYRKLAENIDLTVLKQKCPRGFGELCQALEQGLRPFLRAGALS
jgi:Domain of unknown function (DUF4276)